MATTTTNLDRINDGGYRVTCEDGYVRHEGLFATIREVDEFCEWGHCCTRNHKIGWHFNNA
jgi:hypothetical protein